MDPCQSAMAIDCTCLREGLQSVTAPAREITCGAGLMAGLPAATASVKTDAGRRFSIKLKAGK